jgi:hypothetical protein
MEVLRLLLTIAAALDWEIEQMDVKTAFLNGYLSEVIYMEQPVGYVKRGQEHLVCKLEKSLYGLKQAPRVWYYTFQEFMIECGFRRLVKDYCVFIRTTQDGTCVVSVYVDDLMIMVSPLRLVRGFKEQLKTRFQMSDMGPVKYLLGWHIERDRNRRNIFLHQEQYCIKVLKSFNMQDSRPVGSPQEPGQQLSEAQMPTSAEDIKEMEDIPYREAVGSFMYLMMGTRPDLAGLVRQVSRYLKNPGMAHWRAVLRGLKYLNGTREHGIMLGRSDINKNRMGDILSAYSDADYGNCADTKRSVSGFITYLFGTSPISWRSSLQKLVILSTTEAEYVALASTVQEVLYLRALLEELGYRQTQGTLIYEDNQSTIKVAKNPEHHGRCKHIDIRFFFVQERNQGGYIRLEYCPTDRMVADPLTKAIGPQKFSKLCELMGVTTKNEWKDTEKNKKSSRR